MKLRVKNTPFWGEVTGTGGSVERPIIELTTKSGQVLYYQESELTEKSLTETAEAIMWSIFAKDGSRRNQILFLVSILLIGIIFSGCTFLLR